MVPAVRFSLKTLMIAVIVVATLFGIYLTLPSDIAIRILMIGAGLAFPATLVGTVMGHGYVRAFALGAMPPTLLYILWLMRRDPSYLYLVDPDDALFVKLMFPCGAIVAIVCGFVGLAMWRIREKTNTPSREHDDEIRSNVS